MHLALERFGRLEPGRVAAPAIRLAREGFRVEAHLAKAIEKNREAIAADPGLASQFLHEDGSPYAEGETLARPGLASTLELFATAGAAPFYDGPLADDIVNTIRKSTGIVTRNDLSAYEPVQRPPVLFQFKGWQLIGMAPPSSGGGVIGEVLAVLEPYSVVDLGRNSVTYLHLLTETLKASFADRASLYGDPEYHPVPLAKLLSPAHATSIRERISPARVSTPASWGDRSVPVDAGTSHISVIDEDGNAVAVTTSINTSFGAKLAVPGRGILLNNTMDDFSLQPGVPNAYGLLGSEANSIAAGKRPLSSMSPTVVVKDGRARLAVGASGGPLIITGTLQTMLNALVFGLDVERAVRAPRIHNQWMPDVLVIETGIVEIRRDALARLGHNVRTTERGASVQAVEVVTVDGKRTVRAASDPRKGGVAAAQ